MYSARFEPLADGIYRLRVPFESIYTSVFLLTADTGTVLLDCASNAEDVQHYILPALAQMHGTPDYILCSHLHGDHCGGAESLLAAFPDAQFGLFDCFSDRWRAAVHFCGGEVLFDRFLVLHLPGHTPDSLGVLDRKTGMLLSCDSLQQYGVDRFRTYLEVPEAYRETIGRLRQMEIGCICFAHDYEPFGCMVRGEEEIRKCLDLCEKTIG